VKLGLQLYQVDHRSYLLDFRNLNTNIDDRHPSLNGEHGLFNFLVCLENIFLLLFEELDEDEMENVQPHRSLSWDFTENENAVTSPEESVSEVMEFFEMAASLIRTLAPDPTPKSIPQVSTTSS
jgi:hypothetical protein